MKKLLILTVIFLFCFTASAGVKGITILSQEHHVSGLAKGTLESDSYDITDTAAVSGSALALWWDEGRYSEDDPGINRVNSSAGNFSVIAVDQSIWTFTDSRATAESTYTFSPIATRLQFQYSGAVEMHFFENIVSVSLYDITDDIPVDFRKWTTEISSGISFTEDVSYTLDPSHIYQMQLYATVLAGDNPGVTSSLEVSIIPEPFSLVVLGLGGFMLFFISRVSRMV